MNPNLLTRAIIGAAIEVHKELGPGKPEAAYEAALSHELRLRRIPHQSQKALPVVYKGVKLECGYRLDALVENSEVVEAKAVDGVHPIHRAQGLTYLKLGGWKIGLLQNFNVAVLKDGIERLVLSSSADPVLSAAFRTKAVPNQPIFHSGRSCGDEETEGLAAGVIGAALEVHRHLGPGLLPSAYEACLWRELQLRGIPARRRLPLPLSYKGVMLRSTDEVDLLVGNSLVVKPSSCNGIQPVQRADLLTQLRLGGWRLGLIINFNTVLLKDGIRRVVLSDSGVRGPV